MHITFNTYGLRSINSVSFNVVSRSDLHLSYQTHDLINTLLRINNLIFNILGYMRSFSHESGIARMGVGISIVVLTLATGNRKAEEGLIAGRRYDEAIATGIAQIARGALEAFAPSGRLINATLDGIGTIINVLKDLEYSTIFGAEIVEAEIPGLYSEEENVPKLYSEKKNDAKPNESEVKRLPYRDPNYPIFLKFLYFV